MKSNYQQQFLDAILGSEINQDLLDAIRPAGNLSIVEALHVYRGDYSARMQEALGKNYEATWVLMGDEEFLDATNRYVFSHPSTYTNLSAYGGSFPEFLAKEYEEEVVVMARFERSFWELFNRKNNPARVILPEELTNTNFAFRESVYLFQSPYKLYQLWLKREETNTQLSFDDFEGEQFLVVFKENEKVAVREVSSLQYSMLQCFHESESLEISMNTIGQMGLGASVEDWGQIFEILSYSKRKPGLG